MTTIGEELTAWRRGNPLDAWLAAHETKQMDCGVWLGVATSTIRSWVRGITMPGDESFARMAELMDTDWRSVKESWESWIAQKPGKVRLLEATRR